MHDADAEARFHEADLQFHEAVAAASGNHKAQKYASMIESSMDQAQLKEARAITKNWLDDHQHLLHARRNPESA